MDEIYRTLLMYQPHKFIEIGPCFSGCPKQLSENFSKRYLRLPEPGILQTIFCFELLHTHLRIDNFLFALTAL
jgi:hypothetical protein